MARQVTKYLDSRNQEHASEADADRADMRYAAQKVLQPCCDVVSTVDLSKIERHNREALQPLYDYIGLLIRESEERKNRFG